MAAGLDGWHYPNAYLDSHTVERAGERVLLRTIKGAPETYDQGKIRAFLAAARNAGRLVFPVYSRERHDPIPEGGRLEPWQKILVLEGNYWLLDDRPWRDYRAFFDLRIFLKAGAATLLDGLAARHLRVEKARSSWMSTYARSICRTSSWCSTTQGRQMWWCTKRTVAASARSIRCYYSTAPWLSASCLAILTVGSS